MSRISPQAVVNAIAKVGSMTLKDKEALADKIHRAQPHLLGLTLLPSRFGVDPVSLEVLIHLLLVCYQSMTESGATWPVIGESELETQLTRWLGAVQFADWAGSQGDAAREQYLDQHPERPLLAYALDHINHWLRARAQAGQAAPEDKFVIMAGVTLVNCIAFARVTNPDGPELK